MKILLQIRWPDNLPSQDGLREVGRITDTFFTRARPILDRFDNGDISVPDVMEALERVGFTDPVSYRRTGVVSLMCPSQAYDDAADLVATVMRDMADGTISAIIAFTNPSILLKAETAMFVAGPQFTLLTVSFDPTKF